MDVVVGSGLFLAGAVVSALVGIVFEDQIRSLLLRRGGLFAQSGVRVSGNWTESLAAFDATPERVDQVTCRQRGSQVFGEIVRSSPGEMAGRKWHFRGVIDSDQFVVAAFWIVNPNEDPTSYGAFILAREDAHAGVEAWSGRYWRPRPPSLDEDVAAFRRALHRGENLIGRPIRWSRTT